MATEASVEIGVGERGFTPMPTEPVLAEWGTQGGQHVWLAMRTTGMHPGHRPTRLDGPNIQMTFTYDGAELGGYTARGLFLDGDGVEALAEGMQMRFGYWDETPVTGELTYLVVDQCGVTVEGSTALTVQ